jgi:murein L,D-transpeptidase YcbB/YkuD
VKNIRAPWWQAILATVLCCLCALAQAATANDGRVGEMLRARLEGALADRMPLRLSPASANRALAEFYAARQWAPAWDEPRLQSLLVELGRLAQDGLDPEDYGYTRLMRFPASADPAVQADRELLATRACLLALLHLYRGKVNPAQLDPHWNIDARELDPQQGLKLVQEAVAANRFEPLFERARPVWPYYRQLKLALARLRQLEKAGGWPVVPAGPALRPGTSDARVPLLRQRLQFAGLLPDTPPAVPELYDATLVAAVQRFQREAYLDADGSVGRATLAELNVGVTARINQLRVNLERMRWFRNELTGDIVIVDLAGYGIFYLKDGQVAWRSRVQIGKEYRPSPVFQSAIDRLTISPAWVVPPTILREDVLPELRRNPGYLAKRKLHVIDAAGRELAPSAVNWARPGNLRLRQEPGPDGALGELAVRFANPFAVYLHDTPSKELFGASRRSTSSGCIRVENIHELAVLLLDDPVRWNRAALQAAIDERRTHDVKLARKVPILLGYWTAQVGEDGYVSFRPDVYRRDPPVLAALESPPVF